MFVFVFEDVLIDYTAGMAVIVARSVERAQEMAREEFGRHRTMEKFLEEEPGFMGPTARFPTQGAEEQIRFVFGGS